MIKKYNIDTEKWEIVKKEHTNRETPVKNNDWNIIHVINNRTKIMLDRKYPEFFESMEDYIRKFIKTVPEVRPYNTRQSRWPMEQTYRDASDILTATLRADVHIDKQRKESLATVKKKLIEADARIFDRMDRFATQKQLMVILGDFFNSDISYKSTKGTEQQNKTTEYDAWKKWTELIAEVLYNRSWYTDIDVILSQGNHDENKLVYMRDLLHYYFQNNDKITIQEVKENWRYYYKRWDNLLWFTHWHLVAMKDLPMLMNKENWNAKYKERWTGHRHKDIRQSFHWMNVNTVGAVSSNWEWNDKYGVDHINNELFWVLYHKKQGKIADFYQKI